MSWHSTTLVYLAIQQPIKNSSLNIPLNATSRSVSTSKPACRNPDATSNRAPPFKYWSESKPRLSVHRRCRIRIPVESKTTEAVIDLRAKLAGLPRAISSSFSKVVRCSRKIPGVCFAHPFYNYR